MYHRPRRCPPSWERMDPFGSTAPSPYDLYVEHDAVHSNRAWTSGEREHNCCISIMPSVFGQRISPIAMCARRRDVLVNGYDGPVSVDVESSLFKRVPKGEDLLAFGCTFTNKHQSGNWPLRSNSISRLLESPPRALTTVLEVLRESER